MEKIHIGTSGWSYKHWKDGFYPTGLKTNQWLNHYGSVFSTVEINTTFYHSPLKSTVEKWFHQVPENFIFSIKASRYITHQKKLHDCQESLDYFYKSLLEFKSKQGPILFQLPPSFKINKERLSEFISLLDREFKCIFEFRHESWFVDDIYELLSKNKIALCITDLNGKMSPEEITSNFTYLRLHGPHQAYKGSYGLEQLKLMKRKFKKWSSDLSVYCYFDNDEKGYAIQDAKLLQDLLMDRDC